MQELAARFPPPSSRLLFPPARGRGLDDGVIASARALLEHPFEKCAHTEVMAGGMSRRQGVPLGDRPVNLGEGRGQDASLGRGRRHCWVDGPPEDPGPHPGLIQAWRHSPQGWSALVVYVLDEAAQDVTTVQTWVPAEVLRPA